MGIVGGLTRLGGFANRHHTSPPSGHTSTTASTASKPATKNSFPSPTGRNGCHHSSYTRPPQTRRPTASSVSSAPPCAPPPPPQTPGAARCYSADCIFRRRWLQHSSHSHKPATSSASFGESRCHWVPFTYFGRVPSRGCCWRFQGNDLTDSSSPDYLNFRLIYNNGSSLPPNYYFICFKKRSI